MEIETLEEALLKKIESRFDMRCFIWARDKHSLVSFIAEQIHKDVNALLDESGGNDAE